MNTLTSKARTLAKLLLAASVAVAVVCLGVAVHQGYLPRPLARPFGFAVIFGGVMWLLLNPGKSTKPAPGRRPAKKRPAKRRK